MSWSHPGRSTKTATDRSGLRQDRPVVLRRGPGDQEGSHRRRPVHRVAVTGKIAISGGHFNPDRDTDYECGFVRTYDLATGDDLWEIVRADGAGNDVAGLTLKGKLGAACGYSSLDAVQAADVFGFDQETGMVSWSVSSVPGEADAGCGEIALSKMSMFFDSTGDNAQLVAASVK